MAEVSNIPNIEIGVIAALIGKDQNDEIMVNDFT